MNTEVIIKLGEPGQDFVKRNSGLVKVEKQPAGLNFYQIVWDARNPGRVVLDNGASSLRIPHVLTVLSSEDADAIGRANSSFQNVTIGASLADQELMPHHQALLAFYALLQGATAAGWRPFVSESDPRLSGKERFDYASSRDSTIGLDADYVPTVDEWMRIQDSTAWRLYANHVFMELSFQRDPSRLDPAKPGSYFLSFVFQTDVEYFRGYAGTDHRHDWKMVLPNALAEARKNRSKLEAALKAEGFHIDETYQGPHPPAQ